jgi:hypothetical protein
MENIYLEKIKEIAISKGGECLSDSYVGSMRKLQFKCRSGHIWEATPNSIISKNSWCRRCAVENKKDSLETYQNIAVKHGGVCLSTTYTHSKQKLKFRCLNGHEFETTPINIKHNNQWCLKCSTEKQRSGIEECKELAIKRGGECLDDTYNNQHFKMRWKCGEGHTWEARYLDIKRNNQWCPTCSSGIGERICRLFFEELFEAPFPKAFPDWLINDSGNKMELDGYNSKYNIAFEHQGEQHYTSKLHYSDNVKLAKRIKDDLTKKTLCEEQGIILIEIPEIPRRLKLDDIKQCIYDDLIKRNITPELKKCLASFQNKSIDHNKAYILKPLEPLIDYANKKGGKLLSKSYLGIFEKLEFLCKNGHKFKKAPSHIIHREQWCPICSKIENKPPTKNVEQIENLARLKGGELLSKSSLGAHSHHCWKCSKGHEFTSTPANVSQGKWCPTCANENRIEKTRIEFETKFLKIINEKSGKIHKGKYIQIKQPIHLECSFGHVWLARPEAIFNGAWCPDCRKNDFRTEYETRLLKIISEKAGKLINSRYETMRKKIIIECKYGHIWSVRPDSILGGGWCPACKNSKQ